MRSKVVDFDYYQFLRILRRATDAGMRIDKSDARWPAYVKAHGLNEVAAAAIARANSASEGEQVRVLVAREIIA